jgi:chloramphenicol-sensitive protein RarD
LQFLVAVFLFGEEMPPARIASFCIVWLAIALYLYDWYRAADAARRLPPVAYVE